MNPETDNVKLTSEVWYEIEWSWAGEDEWFEIESGRYSSEDFARQQMATAAACGKALEYRIVRKTTITEVVT